MKKPKKDYEKEVIEIFFKIMREHVVLQELREIYTKQFKETILAYAKDNYLKGVSDTHKHYIK